MRTWECVPAIKGRKLHRFSGKRHPSAVFLSLVPNCPSYFRCVCAPSQLIQMMALHPREAIKCCRSLWITFFFLFFYKSGGRQQRNTWSKQENHWSVRCLDGGADWMLNLAEPHPDPGSGQGNARWVMIIWLISSCVFDESDKGLWHSSSRFAAGLLGGAFNSEQGSHL